QSRILAAAEMSGIQAFRYFESSSQSSASSEVAVVAIRSPKSASLQAALLGKGPVPSGTPQVDIAEWAESVGDQTLLFTSGVQVRTDENGEVVLVGFGQAAPRGKSGNAVQGARRRADDLARMAIRIFLGEKVVDDSMTREDSNFKEYADGEEVFESGGTYEERVKSESAKMKNPGASPVYTWSAPHPGTGETVYGSVMLFSASSARAANTMFADLSKAGGASGGEGTRAVGTNPPPVKTKPRQPARGDSSGGSGAEGEEP
ncbi:MAG: hypothetical protein O2819_09715, partial [Planctomycetota bacterium]|nr:hypothetical protein [Planctomycetota bacterium]